MSIDIDEVPHEYRGAVLLLQAVERRAIEDYLNGYYDAYVYLNSMSKYKGKLKPICSKVSDKDIYRCPREIKDQHVKNRMKEFYQYGIDYCVQHWGLTYTGVYKFIRKYMGIYSRKDVGLVD